MEAGLQVDHAYPFGPAELGPVAPGVVELVLVLVRPLVDGHDVLADAIGLAGLLSRDE